MHIRLWIVCSCEGVVGSHYLTNTPKELLGEELAVFRDEVLWWSLIENAGVDKQLGDFHSCLSFHGNLFNNLRESIDDHRRY